MTDIEQRVARLEQANRRLRAWLAGAGLCLGLVVLSGAQKPPAAVTDEIRVRQLVVVDAEGVERAVLGTAKDADNPRETTVGLVLRDANGKRRAAFVTKDVGGTASLTLLTAGERRRLETWTAKEGGTFIVFDDKGQKLKTLP